MQAFSYGLAKLFSTLRSHDCSLESFESGHCSCRHSRYLWRWHFVEKQSYLISSHPSFHIFRWFPLTTFENLGPRLSSLQPTFLSCPFVRSLLHQSSLSLLCKAASRIIVAVFLSSFEGIIFRIVCCERLFAPFLRNEVGAGWVWVDQVSAAHVLAFYPIPDYSRISNPTRYVLSQVAWILLLCLFTQLKQRSPS